MMNLPVWLQPNQSDAFPVWTVNNRALHCRVGLPKLWDTEPLIEDSPSEKRQFFYGTNAFEGLGLSLMDQADPKSDIGNWVDAILAITGFPMPFLCRQDSSVPKLLNWEVIEDSNSLSGTFEVDEMRLFQGLAFSDETSAFYCLYIILARKAHRAWKIELSLSALEDYKGSAYSLREPDMLKAARVLGNMSFGVLG